MLPSSSAQQLREALGLRLREIRAGAGITGRDLAMKLGRHPSTVSRVEHGAVTPPADLIRAWCDRCGAQAQADDLIASLHVIETMFMEWERLERRGFKDLQGTLLPLYEQTRNFRAYSSWLLPGVVQTEAYTRAVWQLIARRRGLTNDSDDAMPARLARQRGLRDGRHRYAFLIEESVLRVGFGGPDVMLGQLGHLITLSTFPSVSLGIVPARPDRFAWPVEDFWIFDDSQVQVELVSGYLRLTQRRDIGMYIRTFHALSEQAVFGASARALISAAIAAQDSPSGQ